MNKGPVYVSYYTRGTPYSQEALALTRTLQAHKLDYEIAEVPDSGNWTANCGRKPEVICGAMTKYGAGYAGGRPIVFLDADARVKRPPVLFNELAAGDVDIAYHMLDGHELLSGTLYFGNTPWAFALCRKWAEACRKLPGLWDQRVLQQILDENPDRFCRARLPEAYVYIFDRGKLAPGEVVIEHLQASRRYRRDIVG